MDKKSLDILVKTYTVYVPRLYQTYMVNVYSCTWAASTCALKQPTLLFTSASSPIIDPSLINYNAICKQVSVPVSRARNLRSFYLMSASNRFQVNCITMQLSKSD